MKHKKHTDFATVLAVFVLAAAGCASTSSVLPVPRNPLNLVPEPPVRTYRVEVTYTNQDDIGKPTDIMEIRATVSAGIYGADEYCRWESYERRQYRAGAQIPDWQTYEPAVGFDYLIAPRKREPDYIENLPNLDSIPRDLTGFYFYINMIDFHMWDLYINLFLRTPEIFPDIPAKPLKNVGDTMRIDLRDLFIPLIEWENVSSDLVQTAGIIHAEYLGSGKVGTTKTKILSFGQEQTIEQNIYGMGMKMPYRGTNRFLGHMHLDDKNQLVLASYREFVYSKVKAPMGQTVIVHSERDYRIELVAIE